MRTVVTILTVAFLSLSVFSQENKAGEFETAKIQVQNQIQEDIKNLPEETQLQIQKAFQERNNAVEQCQGKGDGDKAKVMEQVKEQAEQKLQDELNKLELSEELKERVGKAIIEIEAGRVRNEVQFKDCQK